MRFTTLCHLLVWLTPLGQAAAFEAPRITGVEPPQVSFGTRVTITGSGFTRRPTVFLTQASSPERIYFRIVSFRETEIVAIARDGVAGAYDLNLKTNGETATLAQGITIELPTGLPFDLPPVLPGDRLRITGENFGRRKGRVWIQPLGEARARQVRVLAWNDTAIEFRIPKVGIGYCGLRVENRAGSAYGLFPISAPSSCERLAVAARVNGNEFASEIERIMLHVWGPDQHELFGWRWIPPLPVEWIHVRFTYDLEHGEFPAEVSGTDRAEIAYGFGLRLDGPKGIWIADASQGTFSIELLSVGEGCLHGRMTGTLVNESDPQDIRRLELGEFRLLMPWRP
ncbi:MAG: IPT/TIG domain-containing protein [Planctomycetes bacterium]|nr:IPT/TIG domain-containing protein [Planctomycetota bacterium]